jgi:rod shape-determining protein MreC
MAASTQSRLPISSEALAEISFLLVLIWMLAGPISGVVLSTHTFISGLVTKSAYNVESTGHLAQQLLVASDRIKSLEKQLAESQMQVTKLKQQTGDVDKLRSLLGLASRMSSPTLACDVISRNPDNWFEQATIDKGAADNVKVGSAVITAQGVVGQIVSCSAHAAVVRLLSDPEEKLGVIIERINQPGVLAGQQKAPPTIDFIPVGTAVEVGDKVVSLGNGGIFPAGHPVGTVAAVRRDTNGTSLSVEIKPSENLLNLTQVLVVPPQAM